MPPGTGLIGRDAEIADLERELHQASAGQFRCILLVADPGIGKTRLMAELLARNERRIIGLSARAYPLGRTTSFGLWAEALDRHLRGMSPDKVSSLCGGFLEDLAMLLRSVAAVHGSTPVHEVPRSHIFEGLAVLLKNLATRSPVVVTLDDVQDADGSSWEALNYLAHNLPDARVLVVGGARPAELAEQTIGTEVVLRLEQEGMLRRLTLGPLSPEGVAELATLILDRQPPGPLVTWLIERTWGNPLFVLGLLRALVEEGSDLSAPALRYLPEGLADCVTSRLKMFDEPSIATLEMLAVLGRPVELAALSKLSDRSLESLVEILCRLVRTKLVVETEQRRDLTYEIVHPLVQEAIYQDIGGARRRALHRLAGRTLLASGRIEEAAPHFARAADAGDEEAIEALREAVRRAERHEAYEEALTILGALVELLPAGDPRWREVLDAMSQAEWVVDDRAETHAAQGLKVMRALDALLEASPHSTLRAMVKLRLASFLAWGQGHLATAEADVIFKQALELFDQAGDRRGALVAELGLAWSHGIRGDWDGMIARAERVADTAERTGETLVEMEARLAVGIGCQIVGTFAEAEKALQRAVSIGRERGNVNLLTMTLADLAVALAVGGRIRESSPLLEEAKCVFPEWRHRALVPTFASLLRWLEGDFPSVLADINETLAANPAGPVNPAGRTRALGLSFAAVAATESDRIVDAQRYAALARSAYREANWFGTAAFSIWADAVLAWREDKRSDAVERLGSISLRPSRSPWMAFLLIDLTQMASEMGVADTAAAAGARLDEIARRVDRDLYRALSALGKAWFELTFGLEKKAAVCARQAAAWFSELGYRAFEGRALDALGRSLAAANRQEAISALERAVVMFDTCGADGRVRHSLDKLAHLGRAGRRAVVSSLGPASLSPREREVARLTAEGLKARQVAERLFISERTVETHLTNVYAKLGVDSKLELVHRAARLTF